MRRHIFGKQVFYSLLMLLAIAGAKAMAQDHHRFFYGKVVDESTRRPISNVNLTVSGTRYGTVTGATGEFSFFTDTVPARLLVSHLGYQTRVILLDETSYSLSIYLSREAQQLAEVEIRANINEAYFSDDHYAVRDYEIDSGMVYLVVFSNSQQNSELLLKSGNGDTLARSLRPGPALRSLFRDCLGYLHVFSGDSAYQIYRKGSQLSFIHPVVLKKFDDVLKNCIASTPDNFYFKKTIDHGLSVEYFGVNRKTLEHNTLSSVKDEKMLKMMRRNRDDAALLWSNRVPDSRKDFVQWNYVHKVLYRPVRTAMYRIGQYLCIFNVPDRQVEFYDLQGSYSYKLAVLADSVDDGRWTGEILIDQTSSEVFTGFLRNGIYSVYRIDLNNGKLHKRTTLLHPFPQKVKVYGGYAYYLYDVAGSADNKRLYRQRL